MLEGSLMSLCYLLQNGWLMNLYSDKSHVYWRSVFCIWVFVLLFVTRLYCCLCFGELKKFPHWWKIKLYSILLIYFTQYLPARTKDHICFKCPAIALFWFLFLFSPYSWLITGATSQAAPCWELLDHNGQRKRNTRLKKVKHITL